MKSLSTSSFTTGGGEGAEGQEPNQNNKPPLGKKPPEPKGQMNTNDLPVFWSYSSNGRCSALFILKSAVWIIRILEKTILLPYFIMLQFSFMFPLKRL